MEEKPTSMAEFLSKQLFENAENLTTADVVEKFRAIARRSQGSEAEAATKFADALEQYDNSPAENKDFKKAVLTILEAFLRGAKQEEE